MKNIILSIAMWFFFTATTLAQLFPNPDLSYNEDLE